MPFEVCLSRAEPAGLYPDRFLLCGSCRCIADSAAGQPVGAAIHHSSRTESENEEVNMPGKKHVRGVGDKEQRQYEHIKEAAQKSGRYGKRAEEVAARTVLKQHKEKGHKQGH